MSAKKIEPPKRLCVNANKGATPITKNFTEPTRQSQTRLIFLKGPNDR